MVKNVKDWCLSRQIWWGHQLPVWECRSSESGKNKYFLSLKKPKKCPICGRCQPKQVEDVFDTWFSSSLWPFGTLNWPKTKKEVNFWLPSDVLCTAKDIINLLEKEEALDYLTELLVSFTRIHSFSTIYRIRKGTWRRLKFSDFDIDSLIRFSRTLDENLRFRPFKKVADICLFILGIFPEYVEKHEWPLSFGDRRLASHPKVKKIGFENYGSYYYQKASNMETAYTLGLHDILNYFAENFKIAEKTLNYITDKYLVFHDKKKLFPI